jgi:hypothetical protein
MMNRAILSSAVGCDGLAGDHLPIYAPYSSERRTNSLHTNVVGHPASALINFTSTRILLSYVSKHPDPLHRVPLILHTLPIISSLRFDPRLNYSRLGISPSQTLDLHPLALPNFSFDDWKFTQQ